MTEQQTNPSSLNTIDHNLATLARDLNNARRSGNLAATCYTLRLIDKVLDARLYAAQHPHQQHEPEKADTPHPPPPGGSPPRANQPTAG